MNAMPLTVVHSREELIDAAELARRWNLPESWIRDHTRSREKDPIPHKHFGMYVRFDWHDPRLLAWLERRQVGS